MTDDWPKIKSRRTTRVSPWMSIVERAVELPGARNFKSITRWTSKLCRHRRNVAGWPHSYRPPYRPALETFTWELPAGLVDPGEDAAACCRREFVEETGLGVRAVHALGTYTPCTARLANRLHTFFVETDPLAEGQRTEPGIELKLVRPAQLAQMILAGEFVLQLHIGALLLAGLHGFIDLDAFRNARPNL